MRTLQKIKLTDKNTQKLQSKTISGLKYRASNSNTDIAVR